MSRRALCHDGDHIKTAQSTDNRHNKRNKGGRRSCGKIIFQKTPAFCPVGGLLHLVSADCSAGQIQNRSKRFSGYKPAKIMPYGRNLHLPEWLSPSPETREPARSANSVINQVKINR